ncbi:MAG: aromatic-ring-hydroxylating dioxygenase subunit beta [Hirschia sp.]|nr:aromatic-ring-hydroxylating dioxygenase subunit beta [Hirschia sp.]MBF18296.1 aromatic-ring-hydroxylating dioxygenase subunit beta [Hirschia sp.]|tara:strand:- start:205 stop:693 length:489 start_codon:yes stop_codon:yes gene_type:complete
MTLTRSEVEDVLFQEAEFLDSWQLMEWAEMYTEDSFYEVTSPACSDPYTADARNTLFLISDRIDRIRGRAKRLLKKTAHAEYPHSKTRHMVSNVRVVEADGDTTKVRANFAVFRTKEDNSTIYMGEAFITLLETPDGVKIQHKRCVLDINSLYNQGRLTIIL